MGYQTSEFMQINMKEQILTLHHKYLIISFFSFHKKSEAILLKAQKNGYIL